MKILIILITILSTTQAIAENTPMNCLKLSQCLGSANATIGSKKCVIKYHKKEVTVEDKQFNWKILCQKIKTDYALIDETTNKSISERD